MTEKKDELRWEGHTTRLEIRTSPHLLKIVDDWRRKQEDLPNRSEAIRRLVEIGAKADQNSERRRR
jgi:metal-responsive CopG/Arc/MetJ family transcriptional regulator